MAKSSGKTVSLSIPEPGSSGASGGPTPQPAELCCSCSMSYQSYQRGSLTKAEDLRRKSVLPTSEQTETTGMLSISWGSEANLPLTVCPPMASRSLENPGP